MGDRGRKPQPSKAGPVHSPCPHRSCLPPLACSGTSYHDIFTNSGPFQCCLPCWHTLASDLHEQRDVWELMDDEVLCSSHGADHPLTRIKKHLPRGPARRTRDPDGPTPTLVHPGCLLDTNQHRQRLRIITILLLARPRHLYSTPSRTLSISVDNGVSTTALPNNDETQNIHSWARVQPVVKAAHVLDCHTRYKVPSTPPLAPPPEPTFPIRCHPHVPETLWLPSPVVLLAGLAYNGQFLL